MAITKTQYEAVQEIYRERRRRARMQAAQRQEEIARKVPGFSALEEERLTLSMQKIRASLGGDAEKTRSAAERMAALTEEKKRLLNAAGFALSDLEPAYTCPLCGDTGVYEGRECPCFKEVLALVRGREVSETDDLPEDGFEGFSLSWYDDEKPLREFGGLTARRVMAANLEAVKQYADGFAEEKPSLFLTGPVGTGKTFLCRCLAAALRKAGYAVCLTSSQAFFKAAEAEAFDREDGDPALLGEIAAADLLILDDLGTEFTSRRLAQNALFTLISERLQKGQGTVISSNEGLNGIEDQYTSRVASRIAGEFTILRFVGPDIRLAKKRAANP